MLTPHSSLLLLLHPQLTTLQALKEEMGLFLKCYLDLGHL